MKIHELLGRGFALLSIVSLAFFISISNGFMYYFWVVYLLSEIVIVITFEDVVIKMFKKS